MPPLKGVLGPMNLEWQEIMAAIGVVTDLQFGTKGLKRRIRKGTG